MLGGRRGFSIAPAVLALVLILYTSPFIAQAQTIPFEDTVFNGPYIDKLVYKNFRGATVEGGVDALIAALITNQIDMIDDNVYEDYYAELRAIEEIDLHLHLRNGYGHLTINCGKYPYNITAFRRAVAFALDKDTITDYIFGGESQPHDSIVSAPNPWSIEGQLPYAYYSPQPEIGNQLLDEAGFFDIDGDGYREAPNGSEIHLTIEAAIQSPKAPQIAQFAAEALESLHIEVEVIPTDFFDFLRRLYNHEDYDIAMYGTNFFNYNLDWLERNYGSDYADEYSFNPCNFRNASFDSWIPQLVNSANQDEVYEAVVEMQRILIYECPRIVCYNNYYHYAYRNDVFESVIVSDKLAPTNLFTYLKARRNTNNGGPWGGTLRVGGRIMSQLNHMNLGYILAGRLYSNVHMSLLTVGPDQSFIPYLASKMPLLETNAENPDVPVGHTRLTFDMITNATWSDGRPITAEDVAFTLNYYRDALNYGSVAGYTLEDLVAAYAASPYKVIIEFDTASYWHMENAGLPIVMPKHILETIPVENWIDYNPYFDQLFITSGPFEVSEYIRGEFLELTARTDWAYGIPRPVLETINGTTNGGENPLNPSLIFIGGAVGTTSVVIVGGFAVLRRETVETTE
ncbi:MAG: ABC transporter substrate-binding protein [Candidatus Thorarchaeota archaeon]